MRFHIAVASAVTLLSFAMPANAQGTPAAPKSEQPATAPKSTPASTPVPTPTPASTPAPVPGTEAKPATPAGQPAESKQEPAMTYVTMVTSMGDIVIELNNEKAPISTANFLSYVDKGFYDGTIFHRIIPTFMIQGGGFTPDMKQKATGSPIKNEWQNGLKNRRGTIAMARTSAPDSATCQFFINVVDNAMLDMPNGGAAYAVFGKVVSGMDIVDKIKVVKTGNRGMFGDVPVETVEIKSVKRSEAPAGAAATP